MSTYGGVGGAVPPGTSQAGGLHDVVTGRGDYGTLRGKVGTGGTGTTGAPGSGTPDQNDAFALLMSTLNQYGLGSLADWAWSQLLNNRSANEILLDMYNQPAFKQRFPAIAARQAAGLPPLSPGEYIAYEDQARQMMRAAGFPPGFYDQSNDFTQFLTDDVSLSELSQRVSLYTQAAYQVPLETRQMLKNYYGIDEGGLAAYFADPNVALPVLQQQEQAATIGGDASRQHFDNLTRSEAERLASLGVTDQQAQQGFGQVYNARELFQQLPGEAGGQPTRADALGFVAGDAASQQALDVQARRRKAQFQTGGGFAQTQTGPSGLGSANTN